MDISPKRFTIDSTLELPADHYTAEMADSSTFLSAPLRSAGVKPTVNIQAGLLDASNNPVILTVLSNATIDEYELQYTPTSISTRIRGRDRSALILDSFFARQYQRPITQLGLPSIAPGGT